MHAFDGLLASFMTRTLGNYTAKSFQRLMLDENEPAWTFMILHSSGDSFADQVYNATLGMIVWERLLTAQQVLREAKTNRTVGIVSSVGCRGGAWDFDLIPPAFSPPSVGWALVAGWGSVAYIGQSRVAFEWISMMINFTNGVISTLLGGTSLLHAYILMAWSKGGAKTLGEAYWEGLANYITTRSANLFIDSPPISLGVAMALESILLGDPLLPLPTPVKGVTPNFKPEGYYRLVKATVFAPWFNGTIPVYRPGYAEYLKPGGTGIDALGVAKATGNIALGFLESYMNVETVKPPKVIHFGGNLTGIIMVAAAGRHGYLLAFTPAIGVYAHVKGERLEVKVWGMDVVTMSDTVPSFVYIDGNLLGILFEPSGVLNASYAEPGVHKIVVLPQKQIMETSLYRLLREFFVDEAVLRVNATLSVQAGRARGVNGTVEIPVAVTLRGKPVDADVSVEAPVEHIVVERVAPGHYLVKLYGVKPGSYTVTIRASYSSKYVRASGVAQVNVYADSLVYETGEKLSGLIAAKTSELEGVVKGEVGLAVKRISERLGSVEQSLSAEISDVKTSLQQSIEGVASKLSEEIRSSSDKLYKSIVTHVDESLQKAVGVIEDKLSGKIDEATRSIMSEIDSKVKSLVDMVSSSISQLSDKLDNMSTKLSSLESKVDTAIAAGEAASGLAAAALVAGGVAAALARRRG